MNLKYLAAISFLLMLICGQASLGHVLGIPTPATKVDIVDVLICNTTTTWYNGQNYSQAWGIDLDVKGDREVNLTVFLNGNAINRFQTRDAFCDIVHSGLPVRFDNVSVKDDSGEILAYAKFDPPVVTAKLEVKAYEFDYDNYSLILGKSSSDPNKVLYITAKEVLSELKGKKIDVDKMPHIP